MGSLLWLGFKLDQLLVAHSYKFCASMSPVHLADGIDNRSKVLWLDQCSSITPGGLAWLQRMACSGSESSIMRSLLVGHPHRILRVSTALGFHINPNPGNALGNCCWRQGLHTQFKLVWCTGPTCFHFLGAGMCVQYHVQFGVILHN